MPVFHPGVKAIINNDHKAEPITIALLGNLTDKHSNQNKIYRLLGGQINSSNKTFAKTQLNFVRFRSWRVEEDDHFAALTLAYCSNANIIMICPDEPYDIKLYDHKLENLKQTQTQRRIMIAVPPDGLMLKTANEHAAYAQKNDHFIDVVPIHEDQKQFLKSIYTQYFFPTSCTTLATYQERV